MQQRQLWLAPQLYMLSAEETRVGTGAGGPEGAPARREIAPIFTGGLRP